MNCATCGQPLKRNQTGFYVEDNDAGPGWAGKLYQCGGVPGRQHEPVPPENVSGPVHYVFDSETGSARDISK